MPCKDIHRLQALTFNICSNNLKVRQLLQEIKSSKQDYQWLKPLKLKKKNGITTNKHSNQLCIKRKICLSGQFCYLTKEELKINFIWTWIIKRKKICLFAVSTTGPQSSHSSLSQWNWMTNCIGRVKTRTALSPTPPFLPSPTPTYKTK